MRNCPICEASLQFSFNAKLLKKYDVSYWHCPSCELLKTEDPFWLEEAYQNAIVDADTGLVQRNNQIAKKLAGILFFLGNKTAPYLDVAGGYGILTRLMRDYGFQFYWSDPYCANILARGFEANKATKHFQVLTAFEVLEHVENPVNFLQDLMLQYDCKTILFSTQVYSGKVPDQSWWYYAFNEGQHISFYTHKTLATIAKKLGLSFQSSHGIHYISDKPINSYLFSLLTGRFSALFALYVRMQMKSLTFSDHKSLMEHKS
jgi:Methyltransferase domain